MSNENKYLELLKTVKEEGTKKEKQVLDLEKKGRITCIGWEIFSFDRQY